MLLQRVPQDEGVSPTFDAGSARRAGEGEDLSIQAEPGPRSWPHHQQGAARSPSAA